MKEFLHLYFIGEYAVIGWWIVAIFAMGIIACIHSKKEERMKEEVLNKRDVEKDGDVESKEKKEESQCTVTGDKGLYADGLEDAGIMIGFVVLFWLFGGWGIVIGIEALLLFVTLGGDYVMIGGNIPIIALVTTSIVMLVHLSIYRFRKKGLEPEALNAIEKKEAREITWLVVVNALLTLCTMQLSQDESGVMFLTFIGLVITKWVNSRELKGKGLIARVKD